MTESKTLNDLGSNAELDAEIDRLRKQLAHTHCINGILRKDAERYCWLRDHCTDMENPSHTWIVEAPGELWDDAIDAARSS